MPKNVDFEAILNDKITLSGKDDGARNRAFNELLTINPSDPGAFRDALAAHKDFWKTFPELAIPDEGAEEYIRSDEFLNPANDAFINIHKLVAAQRVSLGLKKVTDDVLIGILQNNEQACRTYLATKINLPEIGNVNLSYGWAVDNEVVLTNAEVQRIQKEAAELLLIRRIEKSMNQTLLQNLKTTGNLGNAKALGFPNDGDNSLTFPLSPAIISAIDKSMNQLKEKKKSFEDYVTNMTQEQIKTNMESFKKEKTNIVGSSLEETWQRLNDDDQVWAEHLVHVRCLQDFLLNNKSNNLIQAFKANTIEAFRTNVKELLGGEYENNTYLHTKLTIQDKTLLQQSIFPAIINQQTDLVKLNALQKASDFTEFKQALKEQLDIDVPVWITENNFKTFQKTVRERQFIVQLNKLSPLSSEQHPQLIIAFNKVGPNQQREMLKPENLKHLLNAMDGNVVKHYLGTDYLKKGVEIEKIVKENTRISIFKGIHNFEVAKVLASFQPPIELSKEQVKAINTFFIHNNTAINLDTREKYKHLIDNIRGQCGTVDKAAFYKAFALNSDGSGYMDLGDFKEKVEIQHERNSLLLGHYNSAASSEKLLMDVILASDKNADFTITAFNETYSKFKKSKDYQSFENEFPKMTKHLTSSTYNAIKAQIRKENIHAGSPEAVKEELKVLDTKLSELKKIHMDMTKHKEKLKKMSGIEPIHVYNPAVQGKAENDPAEMKEKYKEMGHDCDLIVDQLRREQLILNDYLNSLPDTTPSNNPNIGEMYSQEKRTEINKLRKKLQIEKELVEDDLRIYEKVQKTISGEKGILQMVDEASKGKRYGYKQTGSGVTWKDVNNVSEVQFKFPPNTNTTQTRAITGGKSQTPILYELVDKIPAGKMRVYDVTYEQTAGRFTEKWSDNAPVTSKDGTITKSPPEEFVIEAFPQGGPGSTLSDQALKDAKVNFSMAMASQILASMDTKPDKNHPLILEGSDEEELTYLWTALMVLGERTPHMKFGSESIKVNSNHFNPKKEMGTFFWDENSLYKTVFKGPPVDKYVEDLSKVSGEKFGHGSEIKQVNKTANTVTGLFKGKLKDTKEKVEETIKREGPAPKP